MYQAPVGGKSNRKNQNAQARAHGEAMKKAEAESSAQVTTNNQTFQEMLGIVDSIIKDWSSESGKITGEVLDQLEREICWAICFARLVQALYNIGRPDVDHVEFSIEELILHIIPKTKNKDVERFGLCNLKIACKHIAKEGLLKLAVTGNKRQTPESMGKRVKESLKLYQDVDASDIRKRLDRYPVALVFEMSPEFAECKGIYNLPEKKLITNNTRLHSVLRIGYGTMNGKLYFICQNSHGEGWGCKGYAIIFIEEKCDIVCSKEEI